MTAVGADVKAVAANLKAKMLRGHTLADQRKILAVDPDVVGLCEIGGMARALLLKAGFARAGMSMWAAIPTPIVWPKTWTVITKGKEHLSDRTNVGKPGAGPEWLRAKDAPWVLLHEPMGSLHFVINAHLAPQPGLNDKRGALHAQQVDALAAKIAAVKAENPGVICHLLGDLNTPDRSRLTPITDLGLDLGAVTNDLHGHQLTYVASDLDGSRGMIRGLFTDHNAVTANLKHQGAPVPTRKPDYPKADAEVQWFADNPRLVGSKIDPNVVVLHTTESLSWPSYNNGGTPGDSAPHYTARPDIKACKSAWRQHYPETMSSRALRNEAGGVETNTLNCVQVELIGTCDSAKRKTWMVSGVSLRAGVDYIYWPDAPEWALRDLADFLASIHKRQGVLLEAPKTWLPYPASYGNTPSRMTGREWSGFYGVCGHQHVPENSHGDPGDLDIAHVLELAGAAKPVPKPGLAARLRVTLTQALAVAESNGNSARAAWLRAVLAALPGK